jgi:hypothetical protein
MSTTPTSPISAAATEAFDVEATGLLLLRDTRRDTEACVQVTVSIRPDGTWAVTSDIGTDHPDIQVARVQHLSGDATTPAVGLLRDLIPGALAPRSRIVALTRIEDYVPPAWEIRPVAACDAAAVAAVDAAGWRVAALGPRVARAHAPFNAVVIGRDADYLAVLEPAA